jgi:hypothetical protein
MNSNKVHLLKTLLKGKTFKKKVLAEAFGITPMQIYRIEKGLNWEHVEISEDDLKGVEGIDLVALKKRIKSLK